MAKHAVLSASASKRWINCPGSIRLCRDVPSSPPSFYALQGTAAHELASKCLEEKMPPSFFLGTSIEVEDSFGVSISFEVDHDMVDAVGTFVDFVERTADGLCGDLSVEKRFKLDWVSRGMFGTCDAAVDADFLGALHIVDYKHGSGVLVEAEENTQLMIYALGAMGERGWERYQDVSMTIVQPRAPHPRGPVRTWTVSGEYMGKFASELQQSASLALSKDAPLAAGEWCRFCPAAGRCPELADEASRQAQVDFSEVSAEDSVDSVQTAVGLLSDERLSQAMRWVPVVDAWCRAVATQVEGTLKSGRNLDGFKLVRKSSRRRWASEEQLVTDALDEVGLSVDHYMTRPTLKSPAQVEKLGKEARVIVRQHAEKPAGELTVAPESDPRPAERFDPEASAREDFRHAD